MAEVNPYTTMVQGIIHHTIRYFTCPGRQDDSMVEKLSTVLLTN